VPRLRSKAGNLHALEIHIFLEAMPGVGEGQRPTDLVPNGLMTNATVHGITAAPQGQMLRVTYKGSEAKVVVRPGTLIVAYVPADRACLGRVPRSSASGRRRPPAA